MVFEKKYWSEDEYTRKNGADYTGYVGVLNGEAYIFDTEEKLVKNSTYLTQINTSKYFFDRVLDEELHLPYTKKDILFSANDFLNKATVKSILNKLQKNNDYIFKSAIISNTLIPDVEDCAILATKDKSGARFINILGEPIEPDETGGIAQKDILGVNWIPNPIYKAGQTPDIEKLVLKAGDKPLNQYPSNIKNIPETKIITDLENGKMELYSLRQKQTTRTALDDTFFETVNEFGKKTSPIFDFDNIVQTELIASDIKLDENDKKYVKLIFLMLFKTKLVLFQQRYYPEAEDYQLNFTGTSFVDFNDKEKVLVLDKIDPHNGSSLTFLNLQDMRIKNNYLYLVDSELNMALRYNAAYLFGENSPDVDDAAWDIKILRLLDILQGDGTSTDEIYFNNPKSICADDNYIYVADSGNGCIKVYSEDFNYYKSLNYGHFTNQDIQYICCNPYTFELEDGTKVKENSLWVFSTVSNSIFVTVMSDLKQVYFKKIQNIELIDDKWSWEEKIKSVKFSFTNSNYYYICTTKRVYKVHLSRPYYPFASLSYFKQRNILSSLVWSTVMYPWHSMPNGEGEQKINITWGFHPNTSSAEILKNAGFALIGCDSSEIIKDNIQKQFDGDIIFHIGSLFNQTSIDTYIKRNNVKFNEIPNNELAKMVECSGIFIYNEPSTYISSISDPKIECYITEDLNKIYDGEYINPITFNKSIYKLVSNVVGLKNTLMGKFQAGTNLDNIVVYDSLILDDYFQLTRIENNDDFFIHDNEPTSIVLNRIFEKIYDIQEKFVAHMNAKFISSPSFTNNNFRMI